MSLDSEYQYKDTSVFPAGSTATLTMSDLVVNQTSTTAVEISFSKLKASVQPTSIEITTQRLLSDGTNDGSAVVSTATITNNSDQLVFAVGSLTSERRYKFTIQAKTSVAYGNLLSTQIELASSSFNGKVIGSPLDPKNIGKGKSYLTISNNTKLKDEFAVSSREFLAITIPAQTTAILTGTYSVDQAMKNNTESYFSFGTPLVSAHLFLLKQSRNNLEQPKNFPREIKICKVPPARQLDQMVNAKTLPALLQTQVKVLYQLSNF